jgi:putative ABC transport system permease protein
MVLKQSINLALQTFHKGKLRTFMTVFGIMIGIAMVIIVLSAGNGIRGLILEEVSSFGDNWINIEIKVPETQKNSTENANDIASGVTITTLTEEDMKAIKKLDNVKTGYSGITSQAVVSYRNEKVRPSIFGVSAEYIDITDADLQAGRFYTENENNSFSQVIVLGHDVKQTLFGDNPAVGEQVKVDGKGYRVLGVMEQLGATGFFNMDEIVYIPVKTTQKKIMGINHVLWIIVQTLDNSIAESTAEEIRWIIRDRHEITDPIKDDFAVTTQAEALAIVGTIITGITWLLIALSAISLLVGGIGIMNVMYVSVAERTFEIGLRKAVGAKKQDILKQFLIEAILMTLIGGVIGIIFGVVISFIIALAAQYMGLTWPFKVSLLSIVLGVGFSTSVGLFFGLYPAKKAAKLDAIVALRQE